MTKKKARAKRGRPPKPMPKLNTSPENLAKVLMKQRPLVDVESEQRKGNG